jgi:microcompartment protein CcmK/EutM
MYLARVTGRLVATVISPGLQGVRLQWIQPLDEYGEPMGAQQVACAAIDSGPGDLVEFVDGREAAVALPDENFVPVDATIVGYVSQAFANDRNLDKESV